LIEKEIFYHLCDVHGIMVWQDFIQSASGIENVPAVAPDFLELLSKSAEYSVKIKRNHVSMTIWCGGNELMDESSLSLNKFVPVAMSHPNIAMLNKIVETHDPGKLFLPSSPSGPNFGLDISTPGRNHDVHGPHVYTGTEEHYHIYNKSDSLLHGELGVNGMSSLTALKKFLSPANIRLTDMGENLAWRHHGEWWDSLKRDEGIFGDFPNLNAFIKASQFIQAEGLRYALEANRRRKYRNSGSSIWAFNEAFPNVSNCAVVEYYGIPKMAYYWVRRAYAPIHGSLKYERLFCKPENPFIAEVFIHNSGRAQALELTWEILDVAGVVQESGKKKLEVEGNSAAKADTIEKKMPSFPLGIFFIRLLILDSAGREVCRNTYAFSQNKEPIFAALFDIKGAKLQTSRNGSAFTVHNAGDQVCLFAHGYEESGNATVFIEDNYTTIFPGEKKKMEWKVLHKPTGIGESELVIRWDYFNSDRRRKS
jgi:beta-mannosidase